MGFNTTVIISNDFLHDIARDKEFGKKVSDAASKFMCANGPVDVDKTAKVVAEHHADDLRLLLVGWHTAAEVGAEHNGKAYGPYDEKAQLAALRWAAERMGYRLQRKPRDKSKMSPTELLEYEATKKRSRGAIKKAKSK